MARTSRHSGAKYANGNYKSYQKEYDSSKLQIKKRSALNKENRRRGTYGNGNGKDCLLYTSPSPRDYAASRMPSSA